MTSKPKLSACTISKNEQEDLPGFIEHLINWVDEIVIVDDCSSDKTKEIALSYGSKITFIENLMGEERDFGGQRNICIANATGDWLLHMDVDERVTPQLATEILKVIKTEKYQGYKYRRLNFFLHRPMKGGGFASWNKPQLARAGYHKFINKIHENCIVEGEVGQLNGYMWHLNDVDYKERMRKSVTYSPLEADKLIHKGMKIKWYHLVYYPFARAFKRYFLQKGFMDGIPGLIFALHCFTAKFKVYSLAWNSQNMISRKGIEDKLMDEWEKAPIKD